MPTFYCDTTRQKGFVGIHFFPVVTSNSETSRISLSDRKTLVFFRHQSHVRVIMSGHTPTYIFKLADNCSKRERLIKFYTGHTFFSPVALRPNIIHTDGAN